MSEPVHHIHPSLWARLLQEDPNDVCRCSEALYDDATGAYLLNFLQERYRINPKTRKCTLASPSAVSEAPHIDLQVIIITYLLNAQEIPLVDKLVAGSSLKGGKCFFTGAHGFPLDPLVAQYGRDIKGFLARGVSLGAQHVRYGDAALRFLALPRVPVFMVLWQGDEEYPARISVLFDASIAQHLPLDIIYGLVTEICRRMAGG
jgi:Domain of unknown function (DUF3786)